MISLSARSHSIIGTPSFGPASTNKNEKVQNVLDQWRKTPVEVLTSNPYRSYASHVQKPELPQRLHNIYSLQKI
jgi:hypothetical protein